MFSVSLSMTRGKAQQKSLLNCFMLYFSNLTYKCQDTACQWAIQRTLVSCKVERDLSITLPFNLQVSEITLPSLPYPAYQEGINRCGQYILYPYILKLLYHTDELTPCQYAVSVILCFCGTFHKNPSHPPCCLSKNEHNCSLSDCGKRTS